MKQKRKDHTRDPRGGGVAIGTGNPSFTHKAVKVPPEPSEGQVSCPVCRNVTRLTPRNYLRHHRDLWGDLCTNRRPTDRPATPDLPPITWGGNYLSPDGKCHQCGKPVTGERKFCGQCAVKRSTA